MGEWNLTLSPDTPQDILDTLGYFGHIAVTSGRVDPTRYGDALLSDAQYVGVLRRRKMSAGPKEIGGSGPSFWISDEDGKGHAIEANIEFLNAVFGTVVATLLPPTVYTGTINAQAGLHTNIYKISSRRSAIDYVAELYGCEWRVNNDFTFDIGTPAQLYNPSPSVAIVRTISDGGVDNDVKALPGEAGLDSDVDDFSTRVITVGEGNGLVVAVGTADIDPLKNPYKDPKGNTLVMTRLVSEQNTSLINADARAQLQLNRFTDPKEGVTLSTLTHDIKGDLQVGSYVWVEDREAGLYDNSLELNFKGMRLNPLKLRISEVSWPVEFGMGVSYRSNLGVWTDITQYIEWESGNTTVKVNQYDRPLTSGTTPNDTIAGQQMVDTTAPAAPAFVLPFVTSTYESQITGVTEARLDVNWTTPLNVDGTVIQDGNRYEIRYRTSAVGLYPSTNLELNAYTNAQLTGTNDSPIPFVNGPWVTVNISWGTNRVLIEGLTAGTPFEFQIRAADLGNPTNFSTWSASTFSQTRPDGTAPDTPNPPEMAGNVLAVQMTHWLGVASTGSDFNLNSDINHLSLYSGVEPTFDPEQWNKIGQARADISMLNGASPVVATFNVDSTAGMWYKVTAVDHHGNESLPSAAVQVTALLVDDAHISTLTVSKVIAGIIQSNWVVSADVATSLVGARTGFNFTGFYAYNSAGTKTFDVSSATGNVTIVGKFIASDPIANPGDVITIWPSYPAVSFPTITFESSGSLGPAYMNALPVGAGAALGMNSGPTVSGGTSNQSTIILYPTQAIMQFNTFLPTPNLLRGGKFLAASAEARMEAWSTTATMLSRIAGNDFSLTMEYWGGTAGALSSVYMDATSYKTDCRDGSGNAQSTIYQDTSGNIYIESKNAGTRDGGFMLLQRGNAGAVQWGKQTIAGLASFMSIDSAGGLGGYFASVRKFAIGSDNALIAPTYWGSNSANNFKGLLKMEGSTGYAGFRVDATANAILDADGKTPVYVKNFVIDHPEDADRWLVHACTEGPTAGVEYSGKCEINDWTATVTLPPYFEAATRKENRQIFLTVQLPEDGSLYPYIPRAIPGPIVDGQFKISSDGLDGTIVAWLVKAVRNDVEQFPVTPLKAEWKRAGDGPYTFLEKK